MSNWENALQAKAQKERERVLDDLKDVPSLYPSTLPAYWPNVKAMLIRMILEREQEALNEGIESGVTRAEAHAWRKGLHYAANLIAGSNLNNATEGNPDEQ